MDRKNGCRILGWGIFFSPIQTGLRTYFLFGIRKRYHLIRGSLADHIFGSEEFFFWWGSRSGPTFNGGIGAHARSRRFLRVPCGKLPVFPEVPFSRPVAPRLDTFKAMRHALSHLPSEQPEEERQVQCWVVLSTA